MEDDAVKTSACAGPISLRVSVTDRCRFRCAYCYANFNEGMIENNCRKHNPDSPALLNTCQEDIEIRTRNFRKEKSSDSL